MKKMGILLLVVCMILGSVGFADDGGGEEIQYNVPRSSNQIRLFELEIQPRVLYDIKDFEYRSENGRGVIYMLGCPGEIAPDDEKQIVYTMSGEIVESPEYPEIESFRRKFIEFDGHDAYSLEKDYDAECPNRLRVYNLNEQEDLGSLGESIEIYGEGFVVKGNTIVYHTDYSGSDRDNEPNFYIGTLDPYTASSASVEVKSDTGQVKAFDLNPRGTELIYATHQCTEEADDPKFMIRAVDTATGELIDEFAFSQAVHNDGELGKISSLYVTNNHIVVLSRFEEDEKSVIQRFTYNGDLIDAVEANYQVREITEGPNGSTIYIERRFEEDGDCGPIEVVQVKWKSTETGRPQSIISERTVGGQTTAVFRDDGFGLLRVEELETGAMNYLAPLKSDEDKVRLRIPFEDMFAKVNAGADNLLITYRGDEIALPMNIFNCAELLDGMPCQDDATFEIQLSVGEDGSIKISVQVFVVEQIDDITRVVHRKIIQ